MKVLIPCCEPTRSNHQPRWWCEEDSRHSMLAYTIQHLNWLGEIEVIIYSWQAIKYNIQSELVQIFGDRVKTVELDQICNSQVNTLSLGLEKLNYIGPIFCKDVDSCFTFEISSRDYNYICVEDVRNLSSVDCRQKCFLQEDHTQNVLNIREREIVGPLFSVGGYFFKETETFKTALNQLQSKNKEVSWKYELKISDIIGWLKLQNEEVKVEKIKDYQDYGF